MIYSTISSDGAPAATVDPTVIIDRARDLLKLPEAARDPQIPDGFAPLPGFAAALIQAPAGAIGALPAFAPPAIVSPETPDANPQAAAYRAVESVLALPALPLATGPSWGLASLPPDRPDGEIAAPPTDWPQQDLEALPTSAGLRDLALPELALGERPRPLDLAVRAFEAAPLQPFAEPLPDYAEPEPPDPVAVPDLEEDARDAPLRALIARILAGEPLALDGAAQQTLLDAKLEDLDREERQAEQLLFAKAAAAGFSLPSPALADGLIELAEKGRKQREQRNREVRDETIRRIRETLGTAAETATALERAHAALYTGYVGRLLKTQRFNVKMAVATYDAAVRLYNAKVATLAVLARSWREYAGAVKAQNGAIETQAQGERARAESYRSESEALDAQWGTAKAMAQVERLRAELAALPADEYAARLIGIGGNVAIVRGNLQAYGEAIRAFSQATEIEVERWDAWSAEVAAVESVAGVDSANAREAAAFAQTEAGRAQIYAGYTGQVLQHLGAAADEWREYSRVQRGYMQALTARVQAELQATDAYARALGTSAAYAASWNRAEAGRAEAANTLALAETDHATRQQALNAQAQSAQGRIEAGRRAARAQAAAGLAQSFLGVTSASMRLSGSVGLSQRTADNGGQSFTTGASRTWQLSRGSAATAAAPEDGG